MIVTDLLNDAFLAVQIMQRRSEGCLRMKNWIRYWKERQRSSILHCSSRFLRDESWEHSYWDRRCL